MTFIDFCVKSLNGNKSVKGLKPDPSIGVITSNMKQEAMKAGLIVLGPFSDGNISITNKDYKPDAAKVKVVKIDPNDPWSGYYPPSVTADIETALESEKTSNIWIFGPTQCGKTVCVEYIGHKLGRKVETINCVGDMPSSHFFGRNTVVIDPITKQNHIQFVKGIVEKSMTEGLDENGKIIGKAGILFIDEAAAMSPMVAIGLNRTLQTNRNVRELVLPEDGNRVVKSHPGWRVILAGNTNGSGANSLSTQIYAAQRRAMDASLMERITLTFRFGYDRKAEAQIVTNYLDASAVKFFLDFKQAIRNALMAGELTTPFSTKRVIDICETYKSYKTQMPDGFALAKAVYYTTFEKLMEEEKTKYNELFHSLFNLNLSDFAPKDDADFV